jgi:uncharacterized protein (DUF58 family)
MRQRLRGAMLALLAVIQLAGLLGGLFAVPLAGVLWVLLGAANRNVMIEPRPHRQRFPSRKSAERPGELHRRVGRRV